jgi:hypothetical protein
MYSSLMERRLHRFGLEARVALPYARHKDDKSNSSPCLRLNFQVMPLNVEVNLTIGSQHNEIRLKISEPVNNTLCEVSPQIYYYLK